MIAGIVTVEQCVPFSTPSTGADLMTASSCPPNDVCVPCEAVRCCVDGDPGALPQAGPVVCFSAGKNSPTMCCPEAAYPELPE